MQDSEAPPRELTVDEAVALAILLQKNEQLVEAQELYRRVLDAAPNHPDALHYAGVLAHQQGHSDRAVALIEQSLAAAPGRADCYNNLGIIFNRRAIWTPRSRPINRRSPSTPITRMLTAILAYCCERRAGGSKPKRPIGPPLGSIRDI